MPHCKNTNLFSEIEVFFQNSDNSAIQAMLNALKAIKMTDIRLGLKTYHNATVSSFEKLQNLLFLPFLGCKDISHLPNSGMVWGSGYNMLYRMMRLDTIDWRDVQARFNKHLLKYLDSHTEKEEGGVVCLVADDTDIAKSGRKMEHIGKVFSHTEGRHILGFKGLVLGRNDGKTFIPLDFSLHVEKGKEGKQGLKAKELKARLSTSPDEGTPAYTRHQERINSKIDTLLEMVKRAHAKGHDFDYLLLDSWFVCDKVIKEVIGLGGGHHVLGMLKTNVNKFEVDGEKLTTGMMVSKFKKTRKKRCRKYHCEYIVVDTELNGTPVRLFLCRRTKQEGWKTLVTTNRSLIFTKAYEIYAMRWSIEVCYKECKQYLRLEGNQAQYFNSQIASVTVCLMQYALLSVVKRMTSYETLGGLFRNTAADTIEFTLYERILLVLTDILEEFTEYIGFPNKKLVQKFLSDKQILEKIKQSKHLKIGA